MFYMQSAKLTYIITYIKHFTNINGFWGMFCTQKSPDSIDDVRKIMSVRRQLSESKTEKF